MPLFWFSLAFLFGIPLGSWSAVSAVAWLILAGAVLFLFPLSSFTHSLRQSFASRLQRALPRLTIKLEDMAMRIRRVAALCYPALPLPPVPLLLCCLFLGAARYQFAQPTISPEHIAWFNGQNVKMVVEGRLVDPPDLRDQFTYLRVKVDRIHPARDFHFVPVRGLLLARVDPGGSWRYGDQVRLTGYLQEPFSNETFNYRDYLAHQDIYSVMDNARGIALLHDQGSPLLSAIYSFRQSALERVYKFFPDPEASLLAGILLGVRTGIPQKVNEAFRLTSTSHVIAISGFNITILAGLFIFVFRRLFGRKRGMILTILVVILYTIMVGASAAVVRAAILAVMGLFGHEVGRRQTGLNSLAIVAAGMSLFQPGVLWDIGFQLSFAATLGLILYADPFLESFNTLAAKILPPERIKRLAGPVGAYLLFTLAAQLTTLPLILHYTGVLSLSALLANPLILPAQPPLMILGGIATLVGLISATLGQWISYLAWPFLAFTIRAVELLAGIPAGVLHLDSLGLPLIGLYYVTLFGWSLKRWLKSRQAEQALAQTNSPPSTEKPGLLNQAVQALRLRPWLPLLVLGILAMVSWREALSAPDGNLHITILNVGSGEAILIRTPAGRNLLVNGGPSGLVLADALGRRLPPGQRQFDWWVIANGDEEAVAGLSPILDRYPPDQVIWAGPTHGTYASRQLWEALIASELPVTTAQTGQVLELDGGGSLQMLEVGSRGATLLLSWQDFRLLLPIGMNFEAMEHLQPQIQPVTALLLAESGYAPLNPDEWLEALDPQLVLLSVAADDRQGLPDAEVMEALDGYTILRTDQNGWIELSTDGKQIWLEVERK